MASIEASQRRELLAAIVRSEGALDRAYTRVLADRHKRLRSQNGAPSLAASASATPRRQAGSASSATPSPRRATITQWIEAAPSTLRAASTTQPAATPAPGGAAARRVPPVPEVPSDLLWALAPDALRAELAQRLGGAMHDSAALPKTQAHERLCRRVEVIRHMQEEDALALPHGPGGDAPTPEGPSSASLHPADPDQRPGGAADAALPTTTHQRRQLPQEQFMQFATRSAVTLLFAFMRQAWASPSLKDEACVAILHEALDLASSLPLATLFDTYHNGFTGGTGASASNWSFTINKAISFLQSAARQSSDEEETALLVMLELELCAQIGSTERILRTLVHAIRSKQIGRCRAVPLLRRFAAYPDPEGSSALCQQSLDDFLAAADFEARPDDAWVALDQAVEGVLAQLCRLIAQPHDDEARRAFGWGSNAQNELGVSPKVETVEAPVPLDELSQLEPTSIALGHNSTFVVSQDGALYSCGSEFTVARNDTAALGPIRCLQRVKIVAVSAHDHVLALSDQGAVWAWGANSVGQTGVGSTCPVREPTRILKDTHVIDVSAGYLHSGAVSSEGVCFTWGKGSYGRLGHGNCDDYRTPKAISSFPEGTTITRICCAATAHTLALSSAGHVFSWGDGDNGKLGNGSNARCRSPKRLVHAFDGSPVVYIACGNECSAVLTRGGSVYAWGSNAHCRLGLNRGRAEVATPTLVPVPGHVVRLAFRFCSGLAVDAEGNVYQWGYPRKGNSSSTIPMPTLRHELSGSGIKQVAIGLEHFAAWTGSPPQIHGESCSATSRPFGCTASFGVANLLCECIELLELGVTDRPPSVAVLSCLSLLHAHLARWALAPQGPSPSSINKLKPVLFRFLEPTSPHETLFAALACVLRGWHLLECTAEERAKVRDTVTNLLLDDPDLENRRRARRLIQRTWHLLYPPEERTDTLRRLLRRARDALSADGQPAGLNPVLFLIRVLTDGLLQADWFQRDSAAACAAALRQGLVPSMLATAAMLCRDALRDPGTPESERPVLHLTYVLELQRTAFLGLGQRGDETAGEGPETRQQVLAQVLDAMAPAVLDAARACLAACHDKSCSRPAQDLVGSFSGSPLVLAAVQYLHFLVALDAPAEPRPSFRDSLLGFGTIEHIRALLAGVEPLAQLCDDPVLGDFSHTLCHALGLCLRAQIREAAPPGLSQPVRQMLQLIGEQSFPSWPRERLGHLATPAPTLDGCAEQPHLAALRDSILVDCPQPEEAKALLLVLACLNTLCGLTPASTTPDQVVEAKSVLAAVGKQWHRELQSGSGVSGEELLAHLTRVCAFLASLGAPHTTTLAAAWVQRFVTAAMADRDAFNAVKEAHAKHACQQEAVCRGLQIAKQLLAAPESHDALTAILQGMYGRDELAPAAGPAFSSVFPACAEAVEALGSLCTTQLALLTSLCDQRRWEPASRRMVLYLWLAVVQCQTPVLLKLLLAQGALDTMARTLALLEAGASHENTPRFVPPSEFFDAAHLGKDDDPGAGAAGHAWLHGEPTPWPVAAAGQGGQDAGNKVLLSVKRPGFALWVVPGQHDEAPAPSAVRVTTSLTGSGPPAEVSLEDTDGLGRQRFSVYALLAMTEPPAPPVPDTVQLQLVGPAGAMCRVESVLVEELSEPPQPSSEAVLGPIRGARWALLLAAREHCSSFDPSLRARLAKHLLQTLSDEATPSAEFVRGLQVARLLSECPSMLELLSSGAWLRLLLKLLQASCPGTPEAAVAILRCVLVGGCASHADRGKAIAAVVSSVCCEPSAAVGGFRLRWQAARLVRQLSRHEGCQAAVRYTLTAVLEQDLSAGATDLEAVRAAVAGLTVVAGREPPFSRGSLVARKGGADPTPNLVVVVAPPPPPRPAANTDAGTSVVAVVGLDGRVQTGVDCTDLLPAGTEPSPLLPAARDDDAFANALRRLFRAAADPGRRLDPTLRVHALQTFVAVMAADAEGFVALLGPAADEATRAWLRSTCLAAADPSALKRPCTFDEAAQACHALLGAAPAGPTAATESQQLPVVDPVVRLTVSSNEAEAACLLDGDPRSRWVSNGEPHHHVTLELLPGARIERLAVAHSPSDGSLAPASIEVRAGNSLTRLNLLGDQPVAVSPTARETVVLEACGHAHRFVQLSVIASQSDGRATALRGIDVRASARPPRPPASSGAWLAELFDAELLAAANAAGRAPPDPRQQAGSPSEACTGAPPQPPAAPAPAALPAKAFGWGHNQMRQLAAFLESPASAPTCVAEPRRSATLDALGVQQVSMAKEGVLVLTGSHRVQLLRPDGSLQASELPGEAVACATGGYHSLALTRQGHVFSRGTGKNGKLGHGNTRDKDGFKLIDPAVLSDVRAIACGRRHSAAVTRTGQLYMWGYNKHGRLGLGDESDRLFPTLVEGLPPIATVACGDRHTLAVTAGGAVYAWGCGEQGPLGHGEQPKRQPVPTRVPDLQGVVKVACGCNSSAALTSAGLLYVWGSASSSRLGLARSGVVARPTLLEPLSRLQVVDMGLGHKHGCAVTKSGDVYVWGSNEFGQLGQALDKARPGAGSSAGRDPDGKEDDGADQAQTPKLLSALSGHGLNRLACSSSSTIAWRCAGDPLPHALADLHRHKAVPIPFQQEEDRLGARFVASDRAQLLKLRRTPSVGPEPDLTELVLGLGAGAQRSALAPLLTLASTLACRSFLGQWLGRSGSSSLDVFAGRPDTAVLALLELLRTRPGGGGRGSAGAGPSSRVDGDGTGQLVQACLTDLEHVLEEWPELQRAVLSVCMGELDRLGTAAADGGGSAEVGAPAVGARGTRLEFCLGLCRVLLGLGDEFVSRHLAVSLMGAFARSTLSAAESLCVSECLLSLLQGEDGYLHDLRRELRRELEAEQRTGKAEAAVGEEDATAAPAGCGRRHGSGSGAEAAVGDAMAAVAEGSAAVDHLAAGAPPPTLDSDSESEMNDDERSLLDSHEPAPQKRPAPLPREVFASFDFRGQDRLNVLELDALLRHGGRALALAPLLALVDGLPGTLALQDVEELLRRPELAGVQAKPSPVGGEGERQGAAGGGRSVVACFVARLWEAVGEQMRYELPLITSGAQLLHSPYLRALLRLAHLLGSRPEDASSGSADDPQAVPAPGGRADWFQEYALLSDVLGALEQRAPFPAAFASELERAVREREGGAGGAGDGAAAFLGNRRFDLETDEQLLRWYDEAPDDLRLPMASHSGERLAAATATFDPKGINAGRLSVVEFHDGDRTVGLRADGGMSNVWVYGAGRFTSGVHGWTFVCEAKGHENRYVGVGIGKSNVQFPAGAARLLSDGHLKSATESRKTRAGFAVGDSVDVLLDLNQGTVSFDVNGVPRGEVNIPGYAPGDEVRPLVYMFSPGDKFSFGAASGKQAPFPEYQCVADGMQALHAAPETTAVTTGQVEPGRIFRVCGTETTDEGEWVRVQTDSQKELCTPSFAHLDAWALLASADGGRLHRAVEHGAAAAVEPPSSLTRLHRHALGDLRRRMFLLNNLAARLAPMLPLLDVVPSGGDGGGCGHLRVLQTVLSLRCKERIVNTAIQSTSNANASRPTITVRRLRAQEALRDRETTDRVQNTVFGQVFAGLAQQDPGIFLAPARVWKVKFLGEGMDDAGGGYSESISEMCDELVSRRVPLLIPTPNGRGEVGENRDTLLLNPAATSAQHLRMFRFLGNLIGIAIRTRCPVALPLAPCVWRQLLGLSLGLADLRQVDEPFVQSLGFVREHPGPPDAFAALLLPTVCFSADGRHRRALVPGDALTLGGRDRYVEGALAFRLHEFDRQAASVRAGMAAVVPMPLVSLLAAGQLRDVVCGKPQFPLLLLQSMTRVKGVLEDSNQVKWFWQSMRELSTEEQALFLRFVCGRTRLPRSEGDFGGKFFILQVLDKYAEGSAEGDSALPEAATCFFTLRLPKYSSAAVLLRKLRYAIHHCKSIDTDAYARTVLPEEDEAV